LPWQAGAVSDHAAADRDTASTNCGWMRVNLGIEPPSLCTYHRGICQGRNPVLFRTITAFMISLLLGSAASACAVCVDLPETTRSDRLLDGAVVAIASPGADDPFRFALGARLVDHSLPGADLPEVPFLVDSGLRRAMARGLSVEVLLALDDDGAWHRIFTLTPQRLDFAKAVLADGQGWTWEATVDAARFDFFERHHGSADPTLQRMALTEMSRAPYALIRTAAPRLQPETIRARLRDRNEIPFAPILILLLGLQADEGMAAYIANEARRQMATPSRNAAAWFVAGIETGGMQMLDRALETLAGTPNDKARAALVTALVTTGNAHPNFRPSISRGFAPLIAAHPEHAAEIAFAAYDWKAWSLAAPLQALIADPEVDHATRYIAEIVVQTAAEVGN
jgi:hypothetical protein